MSAAITSQGFKFEIGDSASPIVYTEVKEIMSFQAFDGQASEIDVTHLQSAAKEFILGLQDFGSFSCDINYVTGDAGQDLMRAAKFSGAITNFRLTLADATTAIFRGYVQSAPLSGSVDSKVDGSYAIRITGAVTGTAV